MPLKPNIKQRVGICPLDQSCAFFNKLSLTKKGLLCLAAASNSLDSPKSMKMIKNANIAIIKKRASVALKTGGVI